jgi:ribosomal protein S18 acetylase RimI-like enzyme
MNNMNIRVFERPDTAAVIALWEACGLTRPWNNPRLDIERKLTVQPELFLVGTEDDAIVGTVMAGYEGHRGWVNYLAVSPLLQRRHLGEQLMREVEFRLLARGCPKINLQVRVGNDAAMAFYRRIGFVEDESVSFGKRLISDPASDGGAP